MDQQQIIILAHGVPMLLALLFAVSMALGKSFNNTSNRYLVIFFIAFTVIQGFSVITNYLPTEVGVFIIPLLIAAALTIPPTVYLYINSLIIYRKEHQVLKHFALPALFFVLNVIGFTLLVSVEKHSDFRSASFVLVQVFSIGALGVIFPVASMYYFFHSFRSIRKHQLDIGDVYSYEKGINLQWTKVFLWGFVAFFILAITNSLYDSFVEEKSLLAKMAYDIITLVYISFIGVKALQQNAVYRLLSHKPEEKQESREAEKDSSDDEEEVDRFAPLREKLDQVMNSGKPYTNTSLSIYDLAKKVETNYKYLSRMINQEFDMNFVSFVNQYRVEEAKQLLKNADYDNYTIEAIAEMSGFKSKSAFNTAFKKNVGLTPSQFKLQG